MAEELERTLREVRGVLLSEPVSPRVELPADINRHYCRFVAETVAERVDDELDIEVLEDGGRGFVHVWVAHDGRHYDAERVEGVTDYRDLPFFQRHPEAAVHVEQGTVSPATLRQRCMEPLYPEIVGIDSPSESDRVPTALYWKYALAGLLLGGVLVAIGLGGEWALQRHLVGGSARLHTLFVDIEVIGELVLLVSPIVFFVLLPAQRADAL